MLNLEDYQILMQILLSISPRLFCSPTKSGYILYFLYNKFSYFFCLFKSFPDIRNAFTLGSLVILARNEFLIVSSLNFWKKRVY